MICSVNSSNERGRKRLLHMNFIVVALAWLVLITALVGCGSGASLVGAWHNEELGQLLRFHDDETVVIRTPYGDSEATYIFDKSGNKGVITVEGKAISFSMDGDSLLVTMGETQTTFTRGDMEVVAAVAEIAPEITPAPAASPTPAPAETPAPTATPPAAASAPASTPSPAATEAESSAAVSPSAEDEPSPAWSFGILPDTSIKPLSPSKSYAIIDFGDVFGTLIGDSVVGSWHFTSDNSYVLTFNSDNSCTFAYDGYGMDGTYTYAKSSGTGETVLSGTTTPFSVNGDVLTWGGYTFERS